MEAGCDQIKKSAGRQVEKEHYLAATDIQESRIKHDLAKSMREEQSAAGDYRDRGKYASDSGDHKTGQLYEHIAKEEGLHQQEFKEQGQKLSGQYSTTEHLPQTKQRFLVITNSGDSKYLKNQTVSEESFDRENDRLKKASRRLMKGIFLEGYDGGEKKGNGNGETKELPATVQGEPIPDKYRWLIPFIGDEPLPPGTDFLPAVVLEEGERKIDAVLRQLKDGVEGIQDSSQFRLFLATMSKFHDYSISNLILIAIQKPAATKVAGFQTWKNLGRWVKKGEGGIAILAPIMPPKPKKEEKAEEEEEVALSPVYFKVVHVFDIGQTDGKPLPEFDVPVLTGEVNEALFSKALALAKAQRLDVSFESRPHQDPAIKGQYSPSSGIWVRPEEPRAQQLKSLLHELAHYYSEGVLRIPRRDAETIAESGAFAVGAHFGFDSGTRSFPYVALWAQDKKVLQANLASIRKVTTVMLEGLEKAPSTEEKLVSVPLLTKPVLKHLTEEESHLLREKRDIIPIRVYNSNDEDEEMEKYLNQVESSINPEVIKMSPVYRSDKPLFGEYDEECIYEGEPVYRSNKPLLISKERLQRYLPDAKKREEFVTHFYDKKHFPEFTEYVDNKFTEWSEMFKVNKPSWLISAGPNFFFTRDHRILLPGRMAKLYKVQPKGYENLTYWLAHEFCHHVVESRKMVFRGKREEDYANRMGEYISGVSAIDALKAIFLLMRKVWDNEFRGIPLKEAIDDVPEDRSPKQEWLPALDNGNGGKDLPSEGHYEDLIPAFDETFGLRKREFDNRGKPRSEWIKRQEGKLMPALKPFEPYHFAEYVLRFNRFSDAEIPIYSGLTGRSPLRVPDHIWREVIEGTEGEFIKQGDLNVFHIPEKGRPDYMRAAPTWRDITSTIPTKPSTPSPKEELEFVSDSPELIPFTIEDIGYRDKLDNAFEAAIARAKGG